MTTPGYIIVPHGWQREINDSKVCYISPDKQNLHSEEEVVLHLKASGTCKCGLKCPVIIKRDFSYDPHLIPLPDHCPQRSTLHGRCCPSHVKKSLSSLGITPGLPTNIASTGVLNPTNLPKRRSLSPPAAESPKKMRSVRTFSLVPQFDTDTLFKPGGTVGVSTLSEGDKALKAKPLASEPSNKKKQLAVPSNFSKLKGTIVRTSESGAGLKNKLHLQPSLLNLSSSNSIKAVSNLQQILNQAKLLSMSSPERKQRHLDSGLSSIPKLTLSQQHQNELCPTIQKPTSGNTVSTAPEVDLIDEASTTYSPPMIPPESVSTKRQQQPKAERTPTDQCTTQSMEKPSSNAIPAVPEPTAHSTNPPCNKTNTMIEANKTLNKNTKEHTVLESDTPDKSETESNLEDEAQSIDSNSSEERIERATIILDDCSESPVVYNSDTGGCASSASSDERHSDCSPDPTMSPCPSSVSEPEVSAESKADDHAVVTTISSPLSSDSTTHSTVSLNTVHSEPYSVQVPLNQYPITSTSSETTSNCNVVAGVVGPEAGVTSEYPKQEATSVTTEEYSGVAATRETEVFPNYCIDNDAHNELDGINKCSPAISTNGLVSSNVDDVYLKEADPCNNIEAELAVFDPTDNEPDVSPEDDVEPDQDQNEHESMKHVISESTELKKEDMFSSTPGGKPSDTVMDLGYKICQETSSTEVSQFREKQDLHVTPAHEPPSPKQGNLAPALTSEDGVDCKGLSAGKSDDKTDAMEYSPETNRVFVTSFEADLQPDLAQNAHGSAKHVVSESTDLEKEDTFSAETKELKINEASDNDLESNLSTDTPDEECSPAGNDCTLLPEPSQSVSSPDFPWGDTGEPLMQTTTSMPDLRRSKRESVKRTRSLSSSLKSPSSEPSDDVFESSKRRKLKSSSTSSSFSGHDSSHDFSVGDVVWAKGSQMPGWPCIVTKWPEKAPLPENMIWVRWFGYSSSYSLVDVASVKSLEEGLKKRPISKGSKKRYKMRENAVREALKARKSSDSAKTA